MGTALQAHAAESRIATSKVISSMSHFDRVCMYAAECYGMRDGARDFGGMKIPAEVSHSIACMLVA